MFLPIGGKCDSDREQKQRFARIVRTAQSDAINLTTIITECKSICEKLI